MMVWNGGVIGKLNTTRSGVWTLEDHFLNRNGIRVARAVSFASIDGNLSSSGLRVYGTTSFPSGGYFIANLDCEFNAKQYIEILYTSGKYSSGFVGAIGIGSSSGTTNKMYAAFNGDLYTDVNTSWNSAAYGTTYAVGDRIGISYDPSNGKFRFWKNGAAQPELDIPAAGGRYPLIKTLNTNSVAYDFTFCVTKATVTYLPAGFDSFSGL